MSNWKTVPHCEKYEVSSAGQVRVRKTGRVLKPDSCSGYPRVNLVTGRTSRKRYFIHKLVAEQFIPNPDGKIQVNHINGKKGDCRVENLEWCTPSENMKHAYHTGLKKRPKGSRHPNAKLDERKVREIRRRHAAGERQVNLAREFGVCYDSIWLIVHNRTWKHA